MPKRKRVSHVEITALRKEAIAALEAENDHPKALRVLDKLVAGGDSSCQCLFIRSSLLVTLAGNNPKSARLPKAIADAERVQKLDEHSPLGHYCMARALAAQDNPFGAEVESLKGLRACASLPVVSDAEGEVAPGFFWTGSVVRVTGTSREDLNGRVGTVTSHDTSANRFAVTLDPGECTEGAEDECAAAPTAASVSLKPVNLEQLYLGVSAEYFPVDADSVRKSLDESLATSRRLTEPRIEQAEALKAAANSLFGSACSQAAGSCERQSSLQAAADKYTEAIELHPIDASLFSNRSACYTKLGERATAELQRSPTANVDGVADLKKGLKDAEQCVKLRPTWPKAHLRLGTALELLGRPNQARDAYKRGANECYPLGGATAAPKSTVGQPLETHNRQDAMFKKLNEGFQRAAAAARTSVYCL